MKPSHRHGARLLHGGDGTRCRNGNESCGSLGHTAATRVARAAALPLKNAVELTDAIGLAAFTVIAVVIAVRFFAEPLWLWGPPCAALSAAGGGTLRDMLRAVTKNPALHTPFYAEICIV
jgi:uncharacterized membrane protein YeiH